MKCLVVDALDSFVYVVNDYLRRLRIETRVIRNTGELLHEVGRYAPDFIVLGPGPGRPEDANYVELIREYTGVIPVLGVCLGHQALALAFGGTVHRAENLMHGKYSSIEHDAAGCFSGIESPMIATRYHSLIVADDGLPTRLEITARSADDDYIMSVRDRIDLNEGVQFHPESIMTREGLSIFRNFAERVAGS